MLTATEYQPCGNLEDIERQVLAHMLLQEPMTALGCDTLHADFFFYTPNNIIFDTIKKLYRGGTPPDAAAVIRAMGEEGTKYRDYVARLPYDMLSIHGGTSLMLALESESIRRNIIDGLSTICIRMKSADALSLPPDGMLAALNQQLDAVSFRRVEKASSLVTMSEAVGDYLADLCNTEKRLFDTGFYTLDSLINGLEAGNLTILAGSTSMGKSALSLNIAHNMLKAGLSVAYFSMEMGNTELIQRFIAMETGVPATVQRRGAKAMTDRQYTSVTEHAEKIAPYLCSFADQLHHGIDSLERSVRRHKQKGDLDVVFVDHLGLLPMPPGCKSRYEGVTELTRRLKCMARENDLSIIVLCQLNRQFAARKQKEPVLSDLRDSGSIEQDADQILMIHRPSKAAENGGADTDAEGAIYGNEVRRPAVIPPSNEAVVFLRKNRHGETGQVALDFNGARSIFCERS